MNREEVYQYIAKTYHRQPEFLWENFPNYAVFRGLTNKWFAIIMDIEREKLADSDDGESRTETNIKTSQKSTQNSPENLRTSKIDILNVKCDPEMIYSLREEPNIFPAYHMNKEHWITIILDHNIDAELIQNLIDQSYTLAD